MKTVPKIQDASLRTEPGACFQFKLCSSCTIFVSSHVRVPGASWDTKRGPRVPNLTSFSPKMSPWQVLSEWEEKLFQQCEGDLISDYHFILFTQTHSSHCSCSFWLFPSSLGVCLFPLFSEEWRVLSFFLSSFQVSPSSLTFTLLHPLLHTWPLTASLFEQFCVFISINLLLIFPDLAVTWCN